MVHFKIDSSLIFTLVIGLTAGWLINDLVVPAKTPQNAQLPLRIEGYSLINPLIICDPVYKQASNNAALLQEKTQSMVDQAIKEGKTAAVSVYYRNLKSGEEFNINQTEKFFPASLAKLPLMIQYLMESERDPSILTTKTVFNSPDSLNLDTKYPPKEFAKAGNTYTGDELIEYMIKYSDNNSTHNLFLSLGEEKINNIFKIMKIQFFDSLNSVNDYITSYQLSLFFRLLYNATYLDFENSEKALRLLTKTDYDRGLTRNLPQDIVVAHKFGIATVDSGKGSNHGELHDCGIIYKPNSPYLLCIMTKSVAPEASVVENVVADISAQIYQNSQ